MEKINKQGLVGCWALGDFEKETPYEHVMAILEGRTYLRKGVQFGTLMSLEVYGYSKKELQKAETESNPEKDTVTIRI